MSTIGSYTLLEILDGTGLTLSQITSVTISDSVTSIKSGAFDSCTNLTSINVGYRKNGGVWNLDIGPLSVFTPPSVSIDLPILNYVLTNWGTSVNDNITLGSIIP